MTSFKFLIYSSIFFNLVSMYGWCETKKANQKETLNDSWYTMQSGDSPWGYYHEIIEKKDGKYFYRYEMKKRDNSFIYQENMGAACLEDLTPVTFNLAKAGEGATEMINGIYSKEKSSGVMTVDIKGNRSHSLKRHLTEGTILEVFFPVYLSKNWNKTKQGQWNSVKVFAEDGADNEFVSKLAKYKLVEQNKKLNCNVYLIDLDNLKSEWCINEKGSLIQMKIEKANVFVKKVESENQAKSFLDEKTKSDH